MDRIVTFRGRAPMNATDLGAGEERTWKLPASAVIAILSPPAVTPVPGLPKHVAGLAAVDVGVIPVLRLTEAPRSMLLCEYDQSPVGILIDEVCSIGEAKTEAGAPPLVELDIEDLLREAHKAMRKFHGSGESER